MVTVKIEKEDFRPMVESIVQETISHIKPRLQYSHAEAADMLGLTEESLHGERRKGRIKSRRGMRGRFFYRPEDLSNYVKHDVK